MIDETLDERGKNYGSYYNVATTSQQLKIILRQGASYSNMEPDMQESLDMICNKLARIVNGNPYYDDSWHDICGYASLIDKVLKER